MGFLLTMTRGMTWMLGKGAPQATTKREENQANSSHEHLGESEWKTVGKKGKPLTASGQCQREHYVVEDTSYSKQIQSQSTTAELKRLNEAVEKLSSRNAQLEQTARDTANEHEKLVSQRELQKTRLAELNGKNEDLQQRLITTEFQFQKVQSQWNHAVNVLFNPYLKDRLIQPIPTASPFTVESIIECIYKDAFELAPLRERHQRLQQEMLANVERTQSISDEEIHRQYRSLTSTIKGLSRSISSEGLEKIDAAFDKFVLLRGVHEHHWNTRSRRKSQVEAMIWSILVDSVFQNPFLVFGTKVPVLASLPDVWYGVFGSDHHHNWPIPSVSSEKWRYITVDYMVQSTGREIFTGGNSDNATNGERNDLQNSVYAAQRSVFQQLYELFQRMMPDYDCERLVPVIQKAFTLAVDMFSQHCRLQIMWPELDEKYLLGVTTGMASIPDSEEVHEGRVVFIVNPGLTKWGDAHGKCLDQRLDVVPALVFIEEHAQEMPYTGPAEEREAEADSGNREVLDGQSLDQQPVGGVVVAS